MAFHTKSEFAALCGCKTGNLTNEIKRGRVVMTEDYIDDSLPINREFLDHRKELMRKKAEELGESDQTQPVNLNLDQLPAAIHTRSRSLTPVSQAPKSKPDTGAATLNKAKAQSAIDKNEIEIMLKRQKYETLMGKNVPTDIVKLIIKQLGQSMINSYRTGAEALLTEIGHKKGLTPAESADLKQKLVSIINQAHDHGIKMAKVSMRELVESTVKKSMTDEQTDL